MLIYVGNGVTVTLLLIGLLYLSCKPLFINEVYFHLINIHIIHN